ncbi:hypothetical protein BH09SUM1_BH09SUM1_11410 [soil metagenome]
MEVESITHELKRLEREYQDGRNAVLAKVRERLNAIAYEREVLKQEEAGIHKQLGQETPAPATKKKRRPSGPRVGSDSKRATLTRLISEGHIKDGAQMTKGLRAVLKDEGFKAPDFSGLQRLFPDGWTIEKNGERGPSARTVFRKTS